MSPYGVAKLATEAYLFFYKAQYGIEYTAMRYANVYGPRQDPHGEAGVVAIFCGACSKDQPVTIFGDGKQTRDYVFVGDVVRANIAAVATPTYRARLTSAPASRPTSTSSTRRSARVAGSDRAPELCACAARRAEPLGHFARAGRPESSDGVRRSSSPTASTDFHFFKRSRPSRRRRCQ